MTYTTTHSFSFYYEHNDTLDVGWIMIIEHLDEGRKAFKRMYFSSAGVVR